MHLLHKNALRRGERGAECPYLSLQVRDGYRGSGEFDAGKSRSRDRGDGVCLGDHYGGGTESFRSVCLSRVLHGGRGCGSS